MNQVEVSDISSLNFRDDWKLNFQQHVDFIPKFLPSDPIQIQYTLYSDGINPFLRNESDNSVLELSGSLILSDESFKVYNLKIDNSNINQDTCFTLFFARTKDDEPLLSSFFEVCMDLPDTVLLKYTNKRNEKGVIFSGIDPFYFRINGIFLPQEDSFENESENFRDQRFTLKPLSSNVIEKRTLTLGAHFGVPNWVARKINIIFSLSAVWVDGISMTRSDGSAVEITSLHNDYPLYIYKIILEESIPVVYNGDIISEIDYARAVDEKKKILRKCSESDVRVYSESSKSSIENALMIRELELIYELSEYYTIEIDDNISDSTKKVSIYSIIKLFSEYFLSKVNPDTAHSLIKFLGGLDFDKMMRSVGAIDSMTAGKGIVMDAERGLVQADRIEVRNSMTVMELILNRLSAMESDYVYSASGVIDNIEPMPDDTYRLTLRKEWEGDFTALQENDIVYGMANDLAKGGTDYYTSWMRVLHVDMAANTADVTLYPDSEVPGGKNYPPCELMVITHRGNPVDQERQAFWYVSSNEHCICMLDGVTKPILEEANYSVIVGRLKHLSIFDNLPINYKQSYVYCRGIATQDMMQIDYEGTPVRSENNRGKWSVAEATNRPYESSLSSYDAVYHYGCKWMCLKTGTTQEPRFGCTDWAMIEGNPDFTIDIESSRGWYFDADRLDTTFRVVGELYNRDVTEHILDADITWTRDTGNPTEDNTWAMAHAEAGKELHLTTADLGPDYMNQIACSFTATALLRDGQNERMTSITKNII